MAGLFGGGADQEISQEQFVTGFQRMAGKFYSTPSSDILTTVFISEAAGMALNADTDNVADPSISQSITEALRVIDAN